ncbi:MAG: T9SS type A sorting domain-containing protein, partial [Bacteroidia bacterium]
RASVENATPSRLDMTYSLSLANIVPATSAFTVKVNSVTRSISSVAVLGTKVYLTLASPVVSGDVVTVAYTKPSSNPLQTSSGGQAASFTAQNVTNNVTAAIPVYVSSVIANATPSRLEMTYNLTLANVIPATSAFAVRVNSTTRAVSSVAISGTKALLTLASPVVFGDVVTVAYTKPSTNPLQTSAGGLAASITAQNVTNNVTAAIPVYVSSVIANATPSRLEMTYNLTLANVIPAISAFAVRVNSTTRAVSSVAISGTKVLLTLASPVVFGDVVTLAYTKPSTNPLQTSQGGQAASITAQTVINNCSLVTNLPPLVTITSPTKSITFSAPADITIEASASDPDGSISKVEFFNGSTKLGERTATPYSFTWKGVAEGTYLLTAVASDNLNSKTVSAAVTVIVEKSSTTVNQLPVVSVTTTGNRKKFKKNEKIIITAEASDPDGTVSKVEFYNGALKIAEVTTLPYSYTLEDMEEGTYEITAIATDNLGATNKSAIIAITIDALIDIPSENIKIYPNPNDGHFTMELLTSPKFDNAYITITNISGERVYRGVLTTDQPLEEFNLSGSAPGTYVLMVTSGNSVFATKKFIKR